MKQFNQVIRQARCRSYLLSLLLLLFISSAGAFAQDARISADYRNRTLEQVFEHLKANTGYEFVYSANTLTGSGRITMVFSNATMKQVLDAVLQPSSLEYEIVGKVVSIRKAEVRTAAPRDEFINGVVTDQYGKGLPGANVLVVGTNIGATTDLQGHFRIGRPAGSGNVTISVSFLGYEVATVTYTGQQMLTIRLRECVSAVDDVVVTGYSARKASELPGSVQKFSGSELVKNSTNGGIFSGLIGETTGLQISGTSSVPGQDGELVLRGMGTIYGATDESSLGAEAMPLIVIDGNITEYTSLSGIISPNDIANITVLKDASSTAVYGSRAATGVIVITTKQGDKNGFHVNFNADLSLATANFGGTKMMNTSEIYEYGKMTVGNEWDGNPDLQQYYPDRTEYINSKFGKLEENFDLTRSTDWRKMAYRTALTQDYSLNISGGSKRMQYYISYNHRDEQGVIRGYDLSRNIFRGRFNFDITSFLSINANINGSFVNSKSPNYASGETYMPWITPYDKNGLLLKELPNWGSYDYDMHPEEPFSNPLLESQYNDMTVKQSDLYGSFGAVVKPLSWLSFTSANTFTLSNNNQNDYYDMRTLGGNGPLNRYSNGQISISDMRETTFLTSNILRAQYSWNGHSLSGLVGQEWYERHSRGTTSRMYDQTVPGERNFGGFSKAGSKTDSGSLPTGGTEYDKASFSFFSEAHYSYLSRYMLSASVRADKSTNFGRNNRTGVFYSVGGAWLISGEEFMKDQKVVNMLKLRASYGTSGKEAGIDYLNYTLYTTAATSFNYYSKHPSYQSQYPAFISQLGNPDLSWEVAYNANVGLDLSMISNRINLSVDLYNRRNSKLIMQVAIPSGMGVGTQYRNVGEMVNKGLELRLNTHNIRTENFDWHTTLSFSYNHNELTKLDNGSLKLHDHRELLVGESVDELKTIIMRRVDPMTGAPVFEKVLDDGTIEEVMESYELQSVLRNYQSMGVTRAPYWGGFNNTFRYKNLEMNIRTSFAFGHYARNSYFADYMNGYWWKDFGLNMLKLPDGIKLWEKPGDIADIPVRSTDYMQAYLQSLEFTNIEYSKASYFKLAQIRLTYYIPEKFLETIKLSNAYVSLTCDNIHTFTHKHFKGLDPESYSGYGAPRRFTFSLNLTF